MAIDMSPTYLSAVEQNLPNATVVFDRFHIVKLMNEKLTKLRRELHREAVDHLHKDVLKGTPGALGSRLSAQIDEVVAPRLEARSRAA